MAADSKMNQWSKGTHTDCISFNDLICSFSLKIHLFHYSVFVLVILICIPVCNHRNIQDRHAEPSNIRTNKCREIVKISQTHENFSAVIERFIVMQREQRKSVFLHLTLEKHLWPGISFCQPSGWIAKDAFS